MKGHGKGSEGQNHALLHIALLEAVPTRLAHAATSASQLLCKQGTHVGQNEEASGSMG